MEKSTLSPTLEIETGYFMKSITVKKSLSKPQKQKREKKKRERKKERKKREKK